MWKIGSGLCVLFFRKSFFLIVLVLSPLSLLAADASAAVVHSIGGVWVNGAEVADSTSIFPGDLLETKVGFVANLDAAGSSVLIRPESIVKFQGNYLSLEHGSVSVGTSTAMGVRVNCIKVEPISKERTQYDVTDVSGTVVVAAQKNAVNLGLGGLRKSSSDGTFQSTTVHVGEQASRIEATSCGAVARPGTAGSAPNMKWIEIGGGAAAGSLVLCILLCKTSNPSSISPTQP